MSTHRQEWNEQLRSALSACVGASLTEVWVDEMGLYGPEDNPSFSHSQLRFVQALVLELRLGSGATLHIHCWQDDEEFALWPRFVPSEKRLAPDNDPDRTLFRTRRMEEFPSGAIGDVKWCANELGNIQSIRLRIDGSEVVLCAGEVIEDWDGRLTVRDADESVLIFLDPADFAATVFNSPAYKIE